MIKIPGMNKVDLVEVAHTIKELNAIIDGINEQHYKIVDIIFETVNGDSTFIIYCALMNEAEKDRFDIANSSVESIFSVKKVK